MSEERCICCGEIIPEGRQVCPICNNQIIRFAEGRLYDSIHNGTAEDINYWRGYIDGCKAVIKRGEKG